MELNTLICNSAYALFLFDCGICAKTIFVFQLNGVVVSGLVAVFFFIFFSLLFSFSMLFCCAIGRCRCCCLSMCMQFFVVFFSLFFVFDFNDATAHIEIKIITNIHHVYIQNKCLSSGFIEMMIDLFLTSRFSSL